MVTAPAATPPSADVGASHRGQVSAQGAKPPGDRTSAVRRIVATSVTASAVVASAFASLAFGSRELSIDEVLRAVFAPDGSEATIIVRELRWPRTLIALVVGAALGTAGAQLQGVTRNPLADPGLLGVSAGAALGVVATGSVLGLSGARGQSVAALLGAGAATVLVFALAGGPRRGPLPLLLAGTAVTALLGAVTTLLVLLDARTLDEYRFWAVGSVAGRDRDLLATVSPLLVLGVFLAIVTTRTLDLLALGDDVAVGLGERVALGRLGVVVSATLLTAASVAVAGPLLLVGLVVPHLARGLVGAVHLWVLPTSALLGSALLVSADVVGRVVARPGELQVGIVTALVGAPFLVALVQRRRLVSS